MCFKELFLVFVVEEHYRLFYCCEEEGFLLVYEFYDVVDVAPELEGAAVLFAVFGELHKLGVDLC